MMCPHEPKPNDAPVVTSRVDGSHNKSVIVVGSYNNVSLAHQPGLRLSQLHKPSGVGSIAALQLAAFERKTQFIGRTIELCELKEWLSSSSLVSVRTIIGPAGIGKTRLAIELADFAESEGWTSGFLRASELHRFVNAPGLSDWAWAHPTLVVVDYAAQKAISLGALLEQLQDLKRTSIGQGDARLRLLLLERDASLQFGWWPKVFGPGGYSDRRIDLAEPQHPCTLNPLTEEHALALATDVMAGHESSHGAVEILDELAQADDAGLMLGNPLFTQIAALSADRGARSKKLSMNGLLNDVVEREQLLMEEKWRKANLPAPFFREFMKLVAAVTLLQGVTLQKLDELITKVASFAGLASFISKERIVDLLSDTLIFDDVSGYRALEPDLVGDHFIISCGVDTDLILYAFRLDRVSLSPRLWRMLAQYEHEKELSSRVAEWVRRILSDLSDNTLALDVFVDDAPNDSSGVTAELIAEARSKNY